MFFDWIDLGGRFLTKNFDMIVFLKGSKTDFLSNSFLGIIFAKFHDIYIIQLSTNPFDGVLNLRLSSKDILQSSDPILFPFSETYKNPLLSHYGSVHFLFCFLRVLRPREGNKSIAL